MPGMEDLTGRVFDRLTVVGLEHRDNKGRLQWYCICKCGKVTIVRSNSLKHKKTKSCGCLRNELAAVRLRERHLKKREDKKQTASPPSA